MVVIKPLISMERPFVFFICALCLALAGHLQAQTSTHFGAPKFAPADGQKLLIIGQDLGSVGGLDSHQAGYVDNVSTHLPAGITTYTDIPGLGGLTAQSNWGAGDIHAGAYLQDSTFRNSFLVIGLYIVNRLSGIKAGFFDSSIRRLAEWVRSAPKPVFIRVGYEFEGPWNDYDPEEYRAAWRHIVHLFDEEEVRNAAFVWQSAGLNYQNIERWYPGDEYVNWVGYSHFDGVNMGQSILAFADEHKKPVMIAEATPRRQIKDGSPENHWRSWYIPLFNRIYDNDRIKALAYINADWEAQPMWRNQGWGDSRVQAVDFIRRAWESEIAKTPWVTASDSLFKQLRFETWLDSTVTLTATQRPLLLSSSQFEVFRDSEKLQISSPGSKMEAVYIWSLDGRLIIRQKYPAFQYHVPLDSLPAGPILISVEKDKRVFSRKFLITPE